jgi:hypothetical protein
VNAKQGFREFQAARRTIQGYEAVHMIRKGQARWLVLTENSVRSENTGVPTIREIMVATTMSSLFVALFALVASSFRTRAALQAEILALFQVEHMQPTVGRRTRRDGGLAWPGWVPAWPPQRSCESG